MRGKLFFEKRGIVSEYLPWIIISIALLAVLMISPKHTKHNYSLVTLKKELGELYILAGKNSMSKEAIA